MQMDVECLGCRVRAWVAVGRHGIRCAREQWLGSRGIGWARGLLTGSGSRCKPMQVVKWDQDGRRERLCGCWRDDL